MRRGILILAGILIILSMQAKALELHNTQTPGENPAIYGSIIAFETHEDHAGKDLNNDGDTGDTVIQYYNIEKQITQSTQTAGKNPQIFAYYIVFTTPEKEQGKDLNHDGDKEDNILQYYDLHEKKTTNTEIDAQNPYLHQYFIVFSAPEEAIGIDYNNDGDTEDSLIRYYDLKTKELTTTKQIGKYPSTNSRRILFMTDEENAEIDLNQDGDKNDKIFQIYSLETKTAYSTKQPGAKTTMNHKGISAYIEKNRLFLYDAEANEQIETSLDADHALIKENRVIYDSKEKINSYSLETKTHALTEIFGTHPDMFESIIAFQTKEENTGDLNSDGDLEDTIIRYAISEDKDKDKITDIMDNCPTVFNTNQTDTDKDGAGDKCDAKDDRRKQKAQKEPLPEQTLKTGNQTSQEEQTKEHKSSKWAWRLVILLLVIAIIIAIKWIPRAYRRRKKSFGF